MHFTNGVEFNFTGSAVTNLLPGQTVLIVKNLAAFTARYGSGFTIAGQYAGALNNAGENLRLDDAVGEKVLDFSYNNSPVSHYRWRRTVARDRGRKRAVEHMGPKNQLAAQRLRHRLAWH